MIKLELQLLLAGAILGSVAGCGSSERNGPSATPNLSGSSTPTSTAPGPENAAVRSGKDLYTMNCMTCHKASGRGGRITVDGQTLNPDDLTSASMKTKTDEKLYGYISDGIVDEGMPAFKKKLTPEEIRSVVSHLRELQK